jgi:transposase-like protein
LVVNEHAIAFFWISTASAKDELVKLATRLIIEEGLEGEAGDAVGRDYYEHGTHAGRGYRNGYRIGRLKTAERRHYNPASQHHRFR